MANVWSALRRRKVVQWGVVYVAAAWGFLQGLEYISESFNWPQQVRQIAVLALVIGLPVVLVLAWYHGDRGQQRITTPEFAILTLLLLLGGGAFWYYQRTSETPTAASMAAQPAAPAAPPLEAAAAPDHKSIAVLPFADMSPAKDQEYMSDGIAEELLNLLAKVSDLKVIARTSSFAFKDQSIEIAEIAKRLNVAHVLEGSVRKSGNKLRITAQLIRTADSTHLWSQTYDRDLAEVFAIQDEIAGAIVQALQINFMGGALERRAGETQNLAAYELVLRASTYEYTEAGLDAAEGYLKQAVELDPGYGAAWDGLAGVVASKTDEYFLPVREGYERARQLAQHASELSPGLAGPHVTLQSIYIGYGDWAAAQSAGQRALALAPTDPGALQIGALLDGAFGRWEEAEGKLRQALLRDPVNAFHYFNLGRTYYGAGRLAESEEM